MAVVFDTRPTAFGDMIIVTGTYESGDTTIELGGFMNEISAFSINPTSTLPTVSIYGGSALPGGEAANITLPDGFHWDANRTTVTLYGGATAAARTSGKFMAIGRRG